MVTAYVCVRKGTISSVSSESGSVPIHKLLWPEYMKLVTLVLFNKFTQLSEMKQETMFIIHHEETNVVG